MFKIHTRMRIVTHFIAYFLAVAALYGQSVEIELQQLADGLTRPVDIVSSGDESLYIVERPGQIFELTPDGTVSSTPFLDIRAQVRTSNSKGDERGLLGLAFHPEYPDVNYVFVNYTAENDGRTRISRFEVDLAAGQVIASSEKVLIEQDQPFTNHNAGDLAFGPDGMLYIGFGDGGSAEDPINAGQNRSTRLGKMLRIDVDQGDPYAIPADNPFVQDDATLDEIWALGLRNPWRYSFDRQTGDLWIADVGQYFWEEIHRQPVTSSGGENYGWRCYEGTNPFNTNGCEDASVYEFPVWEYFHESGDCSITGGFVYRGAAIAALQGKYIYGDYCSGRIWALYREDNQWVNEELLNTPYSISSFGEDLEGELYVADLDGAVYRIVSTVTNTEEVSAFAQVQLSPNPTSERILLQMESVQAGAYQFQILNAEGQVIRSWEENLQGSFSRNLSVKNMPAGLYFLRIRQGQKTVSRRFVKW